MTLPTTPQFIPPDHKLIFGLYFREMHKSYHCRLEPYPKGCAYIPKSVTYEHGPMPSSCDGGHWFVVHKSWLVKAKVHELSCLTWGELQRSVRANPLLAKTDSTDKCECGHKRDQHVNVTGGASMACMHGECKCREFKVSQSVQGTFFVKREGTW